MSNESNISKQQEELANDKPGFFERFKQRWGITSNFQLFLILIVFSINGSFAVWVAKPVLDFVGLERETMNPFLFWTLRILIILPIYQCTLLIVGTLFGQFKFFWAFQKKTVGRFFRSRNA